MVRNEIQSHIIVIIANISNLDRFSIPPKCFRQLQYLVTSV